MIIQFWYIFIILVLRHVFSVIFSSIVFHFMVFPTNVAPLESETNVACDQKVVQTEAIRHLPIFPEFLWRIWAWILSLHCFAYD